MGRYADAVTRILLEQGQARAQGQLGSGAAWGQAAQQLGQIPGQLIAQQQQLQESQQKIATAKAAEADRQAQAKVREQAAKNQETLDAVYKHGFVQDPETGIYTFKRDLVEQGLAQSGQGHLLPKIMQDLDAMDTAAQAGAAKRRTTVAQAVFNVAQAGYTNASALDNLAYLKQNHMIPEDRYQTMLDQLAQDGSTDGVKGLFERVGGALPEYRELVNKEAKRVAELKKLEAETASLSGEKGFKLGPEDIQYDQWGTEIARGGGKKPVEHTVVVPGPNGPVTRLATEEELRQGVPTYRAPTAPPAAREPNWILRNGVAMKVSDAQLQPGDIPYSAAGAGAKPPTGTQSKTLGFFNRAKQAAEDLETVETAIAGQGLAGQTWQATMPNFLQTQAGQTYQQAQRAFTEARLRKDSGAAIPEQEFENDRKTYFVQPGDSPQTLAQKKRARSAMLASMGFEAGPALAGFYGDEAEALLAGYKAGAKPTAPAAPGSAPPAAPTLNEVRTANGETRRWDGTRWVKQ